MLYVRYAYVICKYVIDIDIAITYLHITDIYISHIHIR